MCSQCGKPAVAQVGQLLLCVDCLYKWQQVMNAQFAHQASLLNVMAQLTELHTGFAVPRMQIPEAPGAPVTLNNIRLDKSVVGVINTGEIAKLDLAMSRIQTEGNAELSKALREFTQAILDTKELRPEQKNDTIEHVSFLATQSELPKDQQQTSLIRTVMGAVERTVTNVGALASLWQVLAPMLEHIA